MQAASYGEDLLSTARLPVLGLQVRPFFHADGGSKHGRDVPISQSRIHCSSTRSFPER